MGNSKWLRNSFVYLIVIIAVLLLFFTIFGGGTSNNARTIPISQVLRDAAAVPSTVKEIDIANDSNVVQVLYTDGTERVSRRETATTDFTTQLTNAGYNFTTGNVAIKVADPSPFGGVMNILTLLLPTLIFIGVLVFMMRQSGGGANQALSFGKSRARKFTGDKTSVTFNDVAGVEELKQELAELVEFLKFLTSSLPWAHASREVCCWLALPAQARL